MEQCCAEGRWDIYIYICVYIYMVRCYGEACIKGVEEDGKTVVLERDVVRWRNDWWGRSHGGRVGETNIDLE